MMSDEMEIDMNQPYIALITQLASKYFISFPKEIVLKIWERVWLAARVVSANHWLRRRELPRYYLRYWDFSRDESRLKSTAEFVTFWRFWHIDIPRLVEARTRVRGGPGTTSSLYYGPGF